MTRSNVKPLSNDDLEVLREHRIQGVRRIAESLYTELHPKTPKTPTDYELMMLREGALDLAHHLERAISISKLIIPTDERKGIESYAKSESDKP